MAKKNAKGSGTIRQRSDGRWEARFTVGRDPGTGKQIQRSVYGSTQKEVRQKLTQAVAEIDNGTYQAPSKMTVGQWLDIWQREYLGDVKPKTVESYQCQIKNHINPALGAIKLDTLNAHTIQKVYNALSAERDGKPGLSPKSVKIVHGVLHKTLQQAVEIGYIRFNPANACKLPRAEKPEIKPLDSNAMAAFIREIQGHRFEAVYLTMLFTGLRRGEVCGLTWDCVDLERGIIRINKQLQNVSGHPGEYRLISTKNSKGRTITAAPFVVTILKKHRAQQLRDRLQAGPLWQDNGLVFCNEAGGFLSPSTVYHNYKRVVAAIGLPDARLHDLRHSYAVASLRAGDDIKTVQGNLGHHAASFTLDVYGHVTEEMKQASAARIEQYIKSVVGG